LLRGYRDRAPVDLGAIEATLMRVGRMASDLDEMVELDINPLLADARGVIALDARMVVRACGARRGAERFAIRPYPVELETTLEQEGLGRLRLRPVRPEDWPAFAEAFKRLSPEDVRLRFFAPMRQLGRDMLVRLTQIDYDREMAFVLERLDAPFAGEIIGVVRLAADPDNRRAEFAVVVRSDLKGRGLGGLLMRRIIDYARRRGTAEIFGDMLRENAGMIALSRKLGFAIADLPEGHDILRASLRLAEA
jgi:acetyltransferase